MCLDASRYICYAMAIAASLLIGLFIAVVIGNFTVMKILAKCGFAMFSGDTKKDFKLLRYVNKEGIAWLNIPNVCYAPIMENANWFYRNHNFLKKANTHGELYISHSNTSKALHQFSYDNMESAGVVKYLHDLTTITGSPYREGSGLRGANFSSIHEYYDRAKAGTAKPIEIVDNKGVRKFKLMCAIEAQKGKTKGFKLTSRSDLLKSLINASSWVSKRYDLLKPILVLRYYTDIDNLTLVFYEV